MVVKVAVVFLVAMLAIAIASVALARVFETGMEADVEKTKAEYSHEEEMTDKALRYRDGK